MASWEYFDRPASAVEANLSVMNSRADEALAVANAAIQSLGNVGLDPAPNPPTATMPDIDIPPVSNPTPPGNVNFGSVYQPNAPVFEDLGALLGISLESLLSDIPEFNPTTGAIEMPPTPAPIDSSGMPSRPTLGDVEIPAAPELVLPSAPNLVELYIPDFVFPDLPTFDGQEPTFDEPRPATTLVWSEPVYQSDLLDDVQAKVRSWLQGGTGLPDAVQQALFDRARGREMLTALEAEQTAFDAYAARNFSMPPGMLVEQVNVARERSRVAQNGLSRDILIESQKWEIENLRFAVERGIGLETVLIQQFMAIAQRSFDAAKFAVESEINLFNAMVSLYNSRQQGYRTAAEVFKIKVDSELAKLRVFEAQIQGEIAKGQVNEQNIKAYEAALKALGTHIDIYRAKMDGAKVQSEVVRSQIESYRTDVQAYGEKLDAEKKRFDAYEAQVRAEAAKAGAFEAEARAFAATVSAYSDQSNIKLKWLDSRLAGIRAGIEKYGAQVELERAQIQSSLGAVESRARAYTADVGRYTAEIQGETASIEAALRTAELRLRNNLAYFEANMKQYDTLTTRLVEEGKITLGALDAAARNSAALAQGAMSAIHVQASMSGQGQVQDSQSYNVHINRKGADVA